MCGGKTFCSICLLFPGSLPQMGMLLKKSLCMSIHVHNDGAVMYCLCYCANGEDSSCASRGCGNAIHETAFHLTGFMLFKISFIFFSSPSNGKVPFCDRYLYFIFSSYQSILSFFYCSDRNILNHCYL